MKSVVAAFVLVVAMVACTVSAGHLGYSHGISYQFDNQKAPLWGKGYGGYGYGGYGGLGYGGLGYGGYGGYGLGYGKFW